MSFTCPDCLMISQHPMDERNNFCGNCHRYMASNFSPDGFEETLIRLLRAPTLVAPERIRRFLLGQDWAKPSTMFHVQRSLTRMGEARLLPREQRAMLTYATSEAQKISDRRPPIR